MKTIHPNHRISVLLIAAVFAAGASAQTFVYPAKGQSPDQQKKDEGECHTWAVQQSKYDPANPPPPPAAAKPPTTATGTTPGAGARGAARGAVVGEIVGRRCRCRRGSGRGGRARPEPAPEQRRHRRSSNSRPPRSNQQAGMATYQKARAACLEGRGYTVK